MRRAAIAFLCVAAAAVASVAGLAASRSRTLAFTLGVVPAGAAATLAPGQEACQGPVLVEAAFDAVELALAGAAAPVPPLAVTVRSSRGGATVARGTLPGDAAGSARAVVRIGRVAPRRMVAVCVRNLGTREVALYGAPDAAARGSTAKRDGKPTGNDLDLVLRTSHSRSTLSLLPTMLERAALFRGGWSGAWIMWALLGAILLAVPALLALALATTTREDGTRDGALTSASGGGAAAARARPEPVAAPRSGGRADA